MTRGTQVFVLSVLAGGGLVRLHRVLGLALMGLAACGERSPDAPPHTPSALGPAAVEFELVTSIPGVGASSPIFHRISGVELGPTKDEVYVLDQLRNSVRVFDFAGNLIREFGGEGEGPGRVMQTGGLRVVGDRLHLRDMELNRITWFDWHGEYLGSRTSAGYYPDPDASTVRRSRANAVMRHGQVLASDGSNLGRGILLLLDEGDVLIDTVFTYRAGGTYMRTRAHPEARTRVPGIPSFGSEGYMTPIGDSLVVSVDLLRGVVRWHRVDHGFVSVVQRREIGLTPRPVSLTEADVRAHAMEVRNLARGEILDVDVPQFEAKLRSLSVAPTNGDLWVARRHDDDYESDSFVLRWILVPFDESAPVLELEMPPNFDFRAAVDDLLLGVHVEPETEVQSVRVYRWRVR